MQLSTIEYKQFEGEERYWHLAKTDLNDINFFVGKNSSGKSKTIAIINSLSTMFSDNIKLPYESGHYIVCFEKGNIKYDYELIYKNNIIVKETLKLNGSERFNRDEKGFGTIMAISGEIHKFQIPYNELKITRRDQIQYPYLEDFYYWAIHVRVFFFNTYLGKNTLAVYDKTKSLESNFNLKSTDAIIDIFNRGSIKHKEKFKNGIINDFNSIGFNITGIELGSLLSVNLKITDNPDAEVVGIKIKEKDLNCMTDQNDMSMGMFRALSLIIHFNYYELEKISGTVLIDDIGEGLDFERSSKLIKLLIDKVQQNKQNIQLNLTTNDRFIMNSVDLKYWQVIDRIGCKVQYYNIHNSKKIFEDFKFTGLNNFDFFSTDFFKKGFEDDQK